MRVDKVYAYRGPYRTVTILHSTRRVVKITDAAAEELPKYQQSEAIWNEG